MSGTARVPPSWTRGQEGKRWDTMMPGKRRRSSVISVQLVWGESRLFQRSDFQLSQSSLLLIAFGHCQQTSNPQQQGAVVCLRDCSLVCYSAGTAASRYLDQRINLAEKVCFLVKFSGQHGAVFGKVHMHQPEFWGHRVKESQLQVSVW